MDTQPRTVEIRCERCAETRPHIRPPVIAIGQDLGEGWRIHRPVRHLLTSGGRPARRDRDSSRMRAEFGGGRVVPDGRKQLVLEAVPPPTLDEQCRACGHRVVGRVTRLARACGDAASTGASSLLR